MLQLPNFGSKLFLNKAWRADAKISAGLTRILEAALAPQIRGQKRGPDQAEGPHGLPFVICAHRSRSLRAQRALELSGSWKMQFK